MSVNKVNLKGNVAKDTEYKDIDNYLTDAKYTLPPTDRSNT